MARLTIERNSFAIEFRHPLLLDKNNGKKKIRKGLGTNKDIAEDIVDNFNGLLKDKDLWDITKYDNVVEKYGIRVAEIFFDKMNSNSLIEHELNKLEKLLTALDRVDLLENVKDMKDKLQK